MKTLLAVLLFLGLAASSLQTFRGLGSARALVESLEADLHDVIELAYSAQTKCSVGDEDINYIYDFFLWKSKVVNEQQFELIDEYGQQIKDLQHRVDDDRSRTRQALTLANRTHAALSEIADDIQTIAYLEDGQNRTIYKREEVLWKLENVFRKYLNITMNNLNIDEDKNQEKIYALGDFVGNKRCEYGLVYVPIGESRRVYFKTTFHYAPDVGEAMPGFVAHLDGYKDQYDVLDFAAHLGEVTETYFDINTQDSSEGQVKTKYLQFSWMACQGLRYEFDH